MAKRAMLLKMLVQTIWVEADDDTGEVVERISQAVTVPAADWPGFYDKWSADFVALQEATANQGQTLTTVPMNRAQRRSKAGASNGDRAG